MVEQELEYIKCNFCGIDDTEFLFYGRDRMYNLSDTFRIVRCKKCGLVYINPRPRKEFISKYYPEKNYYSYNYNKESFFNRLRGLIILKYYSRNKCKPPNFFMNILSIILKNKVGGIPACKEDGKILDIGCGSGQTLKILKDIGWRVYGTEISDEAIKNGRKIGVNISRGFLEDIHYPDNFFDVVRIWHVLEHLYDPKETLKEIKRILKPGGELIIGLPRINSLPFYLFKKYWYALDIPRHLYHFTNKNLIELLEGMDFKLKNLKFDAQGGITGSFFYVVRDLSGSRFKRNFINYKPLILLETFLYIILNKLKLSDWMEIRAFKTNK